MWKYLEIYEKFFICFWVGCHIFLLIIGRFDLLLISLIGFVVGWHLGES